MAAMCLAVPGRVQAIDGRMATVDISGVRRQVSLDLVDDVHVGSYVLVHVGFALETIDEEEAARTLRFLQTFFQDEMRQEGL